MAVSVRLIMAALLGLALNVQAEKAPDFTLKSDTGENLNLEEQRGKVVMINFWASWCAPCRKEMPLLEELYDRYEKDGFTLFGINVEQNPEAAEKFLADVGVSFPILYDPESEVSRAYQVNAMPTTVMVDRDGEVRYVNRGYREGDEEKYRKQVRELIGE
ncbi:TlpA family protein disulfide reductase [Marinimicrobium sp. C2-29]|uniref:TlpA family protein disulfide reductase n=1 Tax=Marinimicrobium sp. C2-29 TaxID=3139825 RepID=UPI003138DB20